MSYEETLIMLKPAAFERKLARHLITRFTEIPLTVIKTRLVRKPLVSVLERHYPEEEFLNKDRPFSRARIIKYCASGPLFLLILGGDAAIEKAREVKGHSNPEKAAPGTIRSLVDDTIAAADARQEAYRDLVHTADTHEEAARQIRLWFNIGA
jgi:nucleoside-diphosphate kinase